MNKTVLGLLTRFCVLTSPLALLSATALAQLDPDKPREPWYQFEMIVFAYNQPQTAENLLKNPFNSDYAAPKAHVSYSLDDLFSYAELNNKSINTRDDSELALRLASFDAETLAALEPTEATGVPRLLPASPAQHILSKYHEMLRLRRDYTVLYHRAWHQPLPPFSEVRKYYFSAGDLVIEKPKSDTVTSAPLATNEPFTVEITDQPIPAANTAIETPLTAPVLIEAQDNNTTKLEPTFTPHRRQLQGSVNVSRKNYAHMEFDLWFAQLDDNSSPETIAVKIPMPAALTHTAVGSHETTHSDTRLKHTASTNKPLNVEPAFNIDYQTAYIAERFGHIHEDRRIRSGELYYVDHPLFGIIIKIAKIPHPLEPTPAP